MSSTPFSPFNDLLDRDAALKTLREAGLVGTGYGYVPIRNKPALQLWVMQRSTLMPG